MIMFINRKSILNEIHELRRTVIQLKSALETHKDNYHRPKEALYSLEDGLHNLIKQIKLVNDKFQMLMEYLNLEIVSQPDKKIKIKNDT